MNGDGKMLRERGRHKQRLKGSRLPGVGMGCLIRGTSILPKCQFKMGGNECEQVRQCCLLSSGPEL